MQLENVIQKREAVPSKSQRALVFWWSDAMVRRPIDQHHQRGVDPV